MAAADECEYGNQELLKVLNGETTPEDYVDATLNKHLYNDAKAVLDTIPGYVKGERIDRDAFDMDSDSAERLYSLMIGDRPFADGLATKTVSSVSYATNDAIDRYWANLETLEDSIVRSIITGRSDISAFDEFVEQWLAEGGAKIIQSVQDQYDNAQ